jgi:hypothetical protein
MSDASFDSCARCVLPEYACTCQNGFIKDDGINWTVYVAYQVDVDEYQSMHIRSERENIDSDEISTFVIDSAKSCMFGWWGSNLNESNLIESNLIANHACFVVRITKHEWQCYEVKFTSEELKEAVVVQLENDGEECPVSWPLFLAKYL